MIDELLNWQFNIEHANCFDFCRLAWKKITGANLPDRVAVRSQSTASDAVRQALPGYVRIDAPQDPCLVILDRPALPGRCPHVGVLCHGRLLHATEDGAYHEPLGPAVQRLGASHVSYYLPPEEPCLPST